MGYNAQISLLRNSEKACGSKGGTPPSQQPRRASESPKGACAYCDYAAIEVAYYHPLARMPQK